MTTPKLVQAAHVGHGRPHGPPTLIVLHTTEGGESRSSAESIASWWASPSSPVSSAHYVVDPDSVVQCVRNEDRAWHTPGKLAGRFVNDISIGIEQCGTARQTPEQWADEASLAELDRTARLVAELCTRYGIPIEHRTVEELRAGNASGICGHVDCTHATGSGDHWDPGPHYPWDHVLALARCAAE